MGLAAGSLATANAAEPAWNIDELKQLSPVSAPAGDSQAFRFYSMGYSSGDFYEDAALATSIIFDGDEVFIKNPLFDYTTNTWIKGRREGDKAVFSFPQTLGAYLHQDPTTYAYDYAPVFLFMCVPTEVFVSNPDGEDYSYWTMDIDKESQTLEMTINDDGSITWGDPDPQLMTDLRGIGGFIVADNDLVWDKAAELYDKFEPLAYVNDAPPASATVEKWNYCNRYEYNVVDVATDGDYLWIQNADPAVGAGWMKGEVADGRVKFNSGQYIGVNDHYRRTSFFMGGKETKIYVEDEDYYYMGSKVSDSLTMLYDPEAKTLSSEAGAQLLFIDKEMPASDFEDPEALYYHLLGSVLNPSLYEYRALPPSRPANPTITGYSTYTYTGWGSVDVTEVDFLFGTPNVDVEGQAIPVDDCYYNIFVNGELFSLWNDEFLKLPLSLDGLSDIPYSLHEDYGLFTHSLLHEIYLTSEGIRTIGVKGFYNAPNGRLLETDLVTLDIETGKVMTEAWVDAVDMTEAEEVAHIEYYNLQGCRVSEPRRGEIHVVRQVMTDGSVKTFKAVKR